MSCEVDLLLRKIEMEKHIHETVKGIGKPASHFKTQCKQTFSNTE